MNIFTELASIVGTVSSSLVDAFTGVSEIFYVPGASGGVTIVGYLLIASLAVGLIKLALNLIVRLFTRVK